MKVVATNCHHRTRATVRLGIIFALCCSAGCCSIERHDLKPTVRAGLYDLENRLIDPFNVSDARAIVFIFVRTDCPISNRFAPEIQRIHAKYAARGVSFWIVYPDADALPEVIADHRKDYQLPPQIVRDSQHLLVKKAGVRVTPEAAVFLPNGKRLYRGRIDDRYVDLGKERPAPTRRDLEEVLSSILSGRPVTNGSTVAVGCYIPEVP